MNTISYFGKNFIVGLEGPTLNALERKLLAALCPLGVIFFAKNIDRVSGSDWPRRFKDLVSELRELTNSPNLLLAVDHEGGRVNRFPVPVTPFPAAKHWKENSYLVAQALARELASIDINLDFAPVLDVLSEPSNKVIGDRAFSDNPHEVALGGKALIDAFREEGILSCAKHFPGHGGTIADSHFELPVLKSDLAALRKLDLIPFRTIIGERVPLVMTAHVLYPTIDKECPATLSHKILNEILRDELGFMGATISDDLEMKALTNIPASERAVKAFNAGVDILLEANPASGLALEVATDMAEGLCRALDSGELSDERANLANCRVRYVLAEYDKIKKPSSDYQTVLGCESHQMLCNQILGQTVSTQIA